MTKIAYVGLKKDGESAFQSETGILWIPGSVEEVNPAVAKKMLNHPDVFALAGDSAELSSAKPAAPAVATNPGLPEWAKKGMDVGLTDEQLESLAQVGGPDTEAGAKLWLELTGKPFHTEPPPPKYVMRMPDGIPRVLDTMSRDALHDLAKELRVPVHAMAGAPKVSAALVAAYPLKK